MHCLDCGYDLRNLPEPRCPECGRRFDVFNHAAWGPAGAHRYRTPAQVSGWVAALLAAGASAVVIQIDRGHGPDFFVYGMTGTDIESNFNIWSYRRLDKDRHIVHED